MQGNSSIYRAALGEHLSLSGKYVALQPMRLDHIDQLVDATKDGELWKLKVTEVADEKQMPGFVSSALRFREQGTQLPFIVRRLSDGKVIGTTRYYRLSEADQNLSIGYTWYSKSAQRSAVNTECKLLMLSYAFEEAGCISVQWHTHHDNIRSQNAIKRLGAKFEGVLRNDRILSDGRIRHTHCFSMIDEEWPASKSYLQSRLEAHLPTPI